MLDCLEIIIAIISNLRVCSDLSLLLCCARCALVGRTNERIGGRRGGGGRRERAEKRIDEEYDQEKYCWMIRRVMVG